MNSPSSSEVTNEDLKFLYRAIEIGEAASENNLPIGAVVVLDGVIVAEGSNNCMYPSFNPGGHAEINALNNVDAKLIFENSRKMTLYTNIEPCVMCLGAIVLFRIGRVVYGASDPNRGACFLNDRLDKIYRRDQLPIFVGPVPQVQEKCFAMWEAANYKYRTFRKEL